ncbi:hypothetical protein BDV93DRAFT_505373 [Ceratobasidium sp. AG-I]|nr:hypothetical protein BDV93DRAFT_505373 [Ceratobasidium sp. AG-I]
MPPLGVSSMRAPYSVLLALRLVFQKLMKFPLTLASELRPVPVYSARSSHLQRALFSKQLGHVSKFGMLQKLNESYRHPKLRSNSRSQPDQCQRLATKTQDIARGIQSGQRKALETFTPYPSKHWVYGGIGTSPLPADLSPWTYTALKIIYHNHRLKSAHRMI